MNSSWSLTSFFTRGLFEFRFEMGSAVFWRGVFGFEFEFEIGFAFQLECEFASAFEFFELENGSNVFRRGGGGGGGGGFEFHLEFGLIFLGTGIVPVRV